MINITENKLIKFTNIFNHLYLFLKADNSKEILAKKLEQVKYVSIGADLWESDPKDDYLGTTIHYVYEWIMQTKTLALDHFPMSKTGDNLKAALDVTLESWKLTEKLVGGTSDSGRNIYKAIRLFGDKIYQLPCAAHRMNHVHEDIFKIELVETGSDSKNGTIYHSVKRWDKHQEALVHGKLDDSLLKDILAKNKIKDLINRLFDKCRSIVTSFHHNRALIDELKVNFYYLIILKI